MTQSAAVFVLQYEMTQSAAVFVLQYEMLQRGLLRLATQTAKALEQMKSVFPGNKPAGGVGENTTGPCVLLLAVG